MTDKVYKIRKEVERLKSNLIHGACASQVAMETYCKEEAYNEVLSILDTMQEEHVSEEFEKALTEEWNGYTERGAATVDALEDNTQELAFAKGFYRGANWQKEQIIANTTDAMIGLPYENKDGGYTHLIDVLRPLPVGNNKIAIIFKED